ncbi:MAG: hypothetical protein MJ172_11610 [Clostridia bacterium]|nr:hypothetical protein [Clostridia bacterium]
MKHSYILILREQIFRHGKECDDEELKILDGYKEITFESDDAMVESEINNIMNEESKNIRIHSCELIKVQ